MLFAGMYLLLTYDIKTDTVEGQRALSGIGKLLKGYGVRVQNSVWECLLDPHELESLKREIQLFLQNCEGNVRVYQLPKTWREKIIQIKGMAPARVTDTLIF